MSFRNLSVRAKLYCLMAFFAVSFLGYGVWSHNTLQLAKVQGPYYQQIVQGKDLLADILPPPEYIIESYLCALQLRDLCAEDARKEEMQPVVERLAKLKSEYETRHDFWVKELPDSPMKRAFLVDAHEPAAAFFKRLDAEFVPACLAGNFEAAEELLTGELRGKYESHRSAIDKIVNQVTENVAQSETTYAEVLGSRGTWAIIGVVLALAVGCGFSWYSARVIVSPLRTIATVMQAVGQGDLTQRTGINSGDEVGQIGREVDAAIAAMQAANLKGQDSTGKMARVQSMMEQMPINVMFADRDLKIQYMNPASLKTLKTLESILPVKADQMIGQVIDIFHKRPEHQRKLLADPNNLPHRANIALGKETLDLLVSPVFDQNKTYLGAMVTWEVITAKLAMEQQIKDNAEREKQQAEEMKAKVDQILSIANRVAQGDYSQEITVAGSDAIGQLGEGLAAFFKDKQAAEAKEKVRTDLERQQAEEQRQKVATVLDIVNNVAKGDFALQVPDLGEDAVGQVAKALSQAVGAVRGTMEEVREVAETVASAAQQLCSVSESIASGAQEQASSLEETASSLEEITSTVKQNTDNAQQARQLATSSRDLAEKGGQVVNNAVEAMGAINQASRQIADIITTIDEIAFQTNLLALNAAVEAARAGEQGRGFAVVAAEVRNLAQRSASAAKEIKNLIQDSGRKVDAGTELVNKSGQTLEEIVTSGKRVSDIVTEIAAASKEQLTGIEQVNKAVTQMDQVTQTNAGQTEEMSGSSQSLVANAEQLRELVGRFKLSERQGERHMPSQASASESKSHRPAAKPMAVTSRNGNGRLRSNSAGLAGKSNSSRHELDSIGSKGINGNGFEEF